MRLSKDTKLTSEAIYFRDICRYPVLTDEQEKDLVKRVQDQDPGAIDQLINANLRFVISTARRFRNHGLDYLELINEGNVGLIEAAKKFKIEKNTKFITYAVWWIRQAMQKALFNQVGTVRIPVNKLGLVRKFNKALASNDYNYEETIKSDEFKKYAVDIDEILKKTKSISMETTLRDDDKGSELTLSDVLGNDPNQYEDVEQEEMLANINTLLQSLPVREEQIVRMCYGIGFPRPFTLKEAGEQLGLSRERVRLLRDRSIKKLLYIVKSSKGQDSFSVVIT